MNFVLLCPLFWPRDNAEAYCSTRFASALAKAGHNVHVVAAKDKEAEKNCKYGVLLHKDVKVDFVPIPKKKSLYPHFNLKWLTLRDDNSYSGDAYCKVLKDVLSRYDKPILVTRTYPLIALYVGWRCRKYAYKWIPHFSDPIPWYPERPVKTFLLRLWLRRAFRDSDMVSVTCSRVLRFYRETLGACVDGRKWTLAEHIGDTKLDAIFAQGDEKTDVISEGYIVHSGDMYFGRGLEIVPAIEELNREGIGCEFIQDRMPMDAKVIRAFEGAKHCHIVTSTNDPELKVKARSAQVSLMVDFNSSREYSPFLLSKLVYQLFTDRPLVLISKIDSVSYDYSNEYPEAGLFFGNIDNRKSIKEAVKKALMCDPMTFDRSKIRAHFSEDEVAKRFVGDIERLSNVQRDLLCR